MLRRLGIDIPHDLSITGFDGTNISLFMNPELTTIRQPLFEMGKKAARLLSKRVKNRSNEFVSEIFDADFTPGGTLISFQE